MLKIYTNNDYGEAKVALFDDVKENILLKITKDEFVNIQQKIILFIIINHLVYNDLNDYLKDLVRVVRNLTNRIRHRKTGYIYYTGDLTNEHIHAILSTFLKYKDKDIYKGLENDIFRLAGTGITQASLQQERDKALLINENKVIKNIIFELEDYKYTKGDIHNFLVPNEDKLKFYNKALRDIYSKSDSEIIRSMLTVENYSLKIGWTLLGDKYYFGKINNWEVILTAPNKEKFFSTYFEAYKACDDSIDKMIENYLISTTNFDWRYYFVKYPEMTTPIKDLSSDNNVYAWENDFAQEKMGGSNLNAYHLNPYIYTLSEKFDLKRESVQYDSHSYMEVEGIQIRSVNDGWEIIHFDDLKYSELVKKYGIKKSMISATVEGITATLVYFNLNTQLQEDRFQKLLDFLVDINKYE